jgi:hypothetical protein
MRGALSVAKEKLPDTSAGLMRGRSKTLRYVRTPSIEQATKSQAETAKKRTASTALRAERRRAPPSRFFDHQEVLALADSPCREDM